MLRLLAAVTRLVRRGREAEAWRRRRQFDADLAIHRLESRRLLNADYSLAADALTLDFTDPLASDAVTVSRDGDAYRFELGAGQWSGAATPGIAGQGTDTLLVDSSLANPLVSGISVIDQGDLFVTLDAADFGGLTGGLALTDVEQVQGDAGPFAVPTLSINQTLDIPFSLDALDIDGDLNVTSATSIDENGATGVLRVTGGASFIAGAVDLSADFNGDNFISVADYEVWRTSFNQDDGGDANGDGLTDAADFTIWRDTLGQGADAGSSTIDLGIDLDVQVGGTLQVESRAGGDLNVGADGAGQDSGRTVEFGAVAFSTDGDVAIIEDSADGVLISDSGSTANRLSILAVGDIETDTGALLRAETARLQTTGGGSDIRLDGFVDAVSFTTVASSVGAADANVNYSDWGGSLILLASVVDGALSVSASIDLSDAGVVEVAAAAALSAGSSRNIAGSIILDQLAVDGPVSVTLLDLPRNPNIGNATLVNATDLTLADVSVPTGNFSATATTGNVTNTGRIEVSGDASFSAPAGDITLLPMQADGVLIGGAVSLSGGAAMFAESESTLLGNVDVASLALFSTEITDGAGAQIRVAGDAALTGREGITLGDDAADVLEVGGLATFDATGGQQAGDITVGPEGTANFGALSLNGGRAVIQEDSPTVLQTVSVFSLDLTTTALSDNSNLVIDADLNVVSTGDIVLADNPGDVLTVSGAASFTSGGEIEIGLGGAANFGTLALDTQTLGGGDAVVREGSQTDIAGIAVDGLSLTADAIVDLPGASIDARGNARFESTSNTTLATTPGQSLRVAGQARFVSGGVVEVGTDGTANFGSLAIQGGPSAQITEASSTTIDTVTTRSVSITSAGSVSDSAGAAINGGRGLTITAAGSIVLANSSTDTLTGGTVRFNAGGSVIIGPAGDARFGALDLTGGTVRVQEDDDTNLLNVSASSLRLESAGAITDGFSTINVTGNAELTAADSITLTGDSNDRLTVGGLATFTAGGELTIGPVGQANFGTLLIDAGNVSVQEDSDTDLLGVTADSLSLTSAGAIRDEPTANVNVTGDATLEADTTITLADTAGSTLTVGGTATFRGQTLTIGPDGTANFGRLGIIADNAVVQEDSSTEISEIDVTSIELTSAGSITDSPLATIAASELQFFAGEDITLTDDGENTLLVSNRAAFTAGDDITIGPAGRAEFRILSLAGDEAFVQEDSTTVLDQVAVRTLELESTGSINDLGSTSIVVAEDATLTAGESITLADNFGRVLDVGGNASFTAADRITLGELGDANFGTLSLDALTAFVQEDSNTVLNRVVVNSAEISSDGDIEDTIGAEILVAEQLILTAGADVVLADNPLDVLEVSQAIDVVAERDITIGPAGRVELAVIRLEGEDVFLETDAAALLDDVTADSLVIQADGTITDTQDAVILVSGNATFVAWPGAGNIPSTIILADQPGDQLIVGGLAEFTSARFSGRRPAEDIVLGPAGLVSFGRLSLTGDEALVQEDSSTRLDQVTLRRLELSSTGEIGDVDGALISVVDDAILAATTPFEDIILGDSGANVNFGELLVPAAQHVSLQERDGLGLGDVTIDGTLFVVSTGDVVQTGNTLSADAIGVASGGGGVLINTAEAERFAASATDAVDIAGRSAALDQLLADLADPRVTPGDDAGLAPTTISGDQLAPLAIDSLFGVVLLDHAGDLVIGEVVDPTNASNVPLFGVQSSGGHAFVRTRGDNSGDTGDLLFEGLGPFGPATVSIGGNHVFTAVADGDLQIETGTTELVVTGQSGTGVVNDVSPYLSYDDRDGFMDGQVVLPAVGKEGVGLLVTIPSTELDAPTSRLVGAGNINPETGQPVPSTQFVELTIGRPGEQNLGYHITFADGAVVAGFQDATVVGAGPTPGDVFSHTFTEAFLGGAGNPAFPNLPTEIVVFNDPRINLFDEGGAQNLNRSITPTGASTPERIDQFVLAGTQQLFAFAEEPVPPEVRTLFTPPPPAIAPTPPTDLLLQTSVEVAARSSEDESIRIEFGPLDEAAAATGELTIIEGASEKWDGGADNYLAAVKQAIRESDRPAGRYVIGAQRSGAASADVTIFVKESSLDAGLAGDLEGESPGELEQGEPAGDQQGGAASGDQLAGAWAEAWREWSRDEADDEPTSASTIAPAIVDSRPTGSRTGTVDALMVGGLVLARRAAKPAGEAKRRARRRRPR
ncbi:MAG: hypothetical protein AAGJ46_04550 [Planctomycetota bacterium]